ncbi:MAG: SDR family oxidoreductase, partial [Verrucomicrobia bacterium]|nr:SDR family oxidoreductase [Verrucomicrobiota bacterium]
AGFIGSNIVRELVKQKEPVCILDNFTTGKRENIAEFQDRINLIEGDIRDERIVRKAVDGVDAVLHHAALASVPRSIQDPIAANEINVGGTLNLLRAAHEAKVKRFVFASSSSVYGDTAVLPVEEGATPDPLSPYAVTKLAGEKYAQVFSRIYGLPTVSLRYFNVFGPHQDPNSQYSAVIPLFIKAMLKGQSPQIFGDGMQSRDFIFVEDVVNANLLAATVRTTAPLVLNCACQRQVSLLELVNGINTVLNSRIAPVHQSERPGDIKHSFASIEKIRNLLGYRPTRTFEEGLADTIRYYIRKDAPTR